jgi:SAM-dependent methyltransferase
MTVESFERRGHAVIDLPSRDFKAMKIARLLGFAPGEPRKRLLEVGCGSGGISRWFGESGPMRWDVDAVDVHDVRLVRDGYRFQLVDGTQLPFEDAAFDVVVSNHVIEHVGNDDAQAHHLSELRRVLKPGGVAYLAVPNRWMLVEPHYKLAFLSWWPEAWRSWWLRLWRKGEWYDCRPFSRGDLQRRLAVAGFRFRQRNADALRTVFEIERPDAPSWRFFLKHVPDAVYDFCGGINPTLIYELQRN